MTRGGASVSANKNGSQPELYPCISPGDFTMLGYMTQLNEIDFGVNHQHCLCVTHEQTWSSFIPKVIWLLSM